MSPDELAIRNLIARWTEASSQNDYAALEPLMHPDVLFLTTGNEPFGLEAFRTGFLTLTDTMTFQASAEILEVQIEGDTAFGRSFIEVRVTPRPDLGEICAPDTPLAEAKTLERKGHVLSVYKRSPEGEWQLYRDANLMTR